MTPRLLTLGQAAEVLGLTPHTLYRWAAQHRLPIVRLSSRALRIREADVHTLIAGLTTPADPRLALADFTAAGDEVQP